MDLHHLNASPTDAERQAIDAVLDPALGPAHSADSHDPLSAAAAQARRPLLLPALHAVQARCGWVSPGALGYICSRLHLPPAEGYGVASFYAWFSLQQRPPIVAHVCDDLACKLAGADAICSALETAVGPPGAAGASQGATWLRSPCLGQCERAPAMLVQAAGPSPREQSLGGIDTALVMQALADQTLAAPAATRLPQAESAADAAALRLLRRVGRCDPLSLDAYRAHGGYRGLRRALELGPLGVIREVTAANLVGRGGAAFPTGRKWEAVARAPARPHYLVCNADESEPGTFKDRVLLEEDPYAIVEAMTVAGVATGCEEGVLYLRAEYPLAWERLSHAIATARAHSLLGDDVMGRGVRFDITLRRGAGAYICGEETALFNSLEGRRGEPRNKPPFPVDVGLFGKPTCINNVETLASVLVILEQGAAAYSAIGTPGSAGTKLFCVSGRVHNPGLYEVPLGTPLRQLLELAGGVAGAPARSLGAVLLGGAAGAFVTPAEIDTPLGFDEVRRIGATLGSGVVLVLDDTVDTLALLGRIAAFFRDESCGQCVPCRVGTVRQEELIARLRHRCPHGSLAQERALLGELGQVMRDASICGLGQTASSAIESAAKKLKLFEVA